MFSDKTFLLDKLQNYIITIKKIPEGHKMEKEELYRYVDHTAVKSLYHMEGHRKIM